MDLVRKIYPVFGSGTCHALYAQLSKQADKDNNRKHIGLLSGYSIMMDTFLCAMRHAFRLRKPLTATINSYPFKGIKLTKR